MLFQIGNKKDYFTLDQQFKIYDTDLSDFYYAVNSGKEIRPAHAKHKFYPYGKTKKSDRFYDKFIGSGFLALHINNFTEDDSLNNEYIKKYSSIIFSQTYIGYPSPSFSIVIFALENNVYCKETFEDLLKGLYTKINLPNTKAISDFQLNWSFKPEFIINNYILSSADIAELLEYSAINKDLEPRIWKK